MTFFFYKTKKLQNSYGNIQRSQMAQLVLKKKSKYWGIVISDCEIYDNAVTTKTACHVHEKKLMYGQFIFDETATNLAWGGDNRNKWCWENWKSTSRGLKQESVPSSPPITNSDAIQQSAQNGSKTHLSGKPAIVTLHRRDHKTWEHFPTSVGIFR